MSTICVRAWLKRLAQSILYAFMWRYVCIFVFLCVWGSCAAWREKRWGLSLPQICFPTSLWPSGRLVWFYVVCTLAWNVPSFQLVFVCANPTSMGGVVSIHARYIVMLTRQMSASNLDMYVCLCSDCSKIAWKGLRLCIGARHPLLQPSRQHACLFRHDHQGNRFFVHAIQCRKRTLA